MGPGADPAWIAWAWFHQAASEGNYLEALGYLESLPGDWFRIKIGAYPKALLSAQIHELLGEPQRARDDFEMARGLLEKEVAKRPDDPRYHSSLGIAFAALGRRDEAVREGKRAVELLPMSKDAVYGIPYVIDLAQIHVMLGERDAALAQLEILLSRPTWVSPAYLEMDFRWNRIRDGSGYKQLMKKYSGA
jgi:tetratricopeptide (TPR) repeat protein